MAFNLIKGDNMDKEAILSATKEVLRIAVLGAIGALIAWLTSLDQNTTVIVTLFVLRYIDRYLHKSGVVEKGLTRF